MKWFWIGLLLYVQGDIFTIKSVSFLENNKCHFDQKTNEGYLYELGILVDGERGSYYGAKYDKFNYFCLDLCDSKFFLLSDMLRNDIKSFLSSKKIYERFLRFDYFFIDKLVENINFDSYKGKKQVKKTFKLPEEDFEGHICLQSDGIQIRMHHIKMMFEQFNCMNLLKLNEFVRFLDQESLKEGFDRLDEDLKFDLYYFKNYFDCLKNLNEFVDDMNYLKLIKDDSNGINTNTVIKESEFMSYLCKKIAYDQKKLNGKDTVKEIITKSSRFLFSLCFDHLKSEIFERNIFFPIGKQYGINFYLENFYTMIYKIVESRNEVFDILNFDTENFILSDMICLFNRHLENLQGNVIKDVCESEYVHKHFSALIGKKIEVLNDFIMAEKVVCDYYNILTYVFNLACRFEDQTELQTYEHPIYIDKYKFRIIDGIEIKFNDLSEFKMIKGVNWSEKEVQLTKGVDFFVDEELSSLYCTLEVLRLKNIKEIEIISMSNECNRKFEISEWI